jgi:hypothetical protein
VVVLMKSDGRAQLVKLLGGFAISQEMTSILTKSLRLSADFAERSSRALRRRWDFHAWE